VGREDLNEIHVAVRGRVQGVGFRWFVCQRARRLGVSGWVRNAADGSVEVVAQGRKAAIEQLLSDLGQGPPGAEVRAVDALPDALEGITHEFAILD
jgi:acylphosphatase